MFIGIKSIFPLIEGLHLIILKAIIIKDSIIPHFFNVSTAYEEQVGTYWQLGFMAGEIKNL